MSLATIEAPGTARPPDAIALQATVAITEITGSESFIHLAYAEQRWVALVHGVHDFAVGASAEVFLDPARFYLFDRDGRLLSAPADRRAAA